LEHNNKRFNNFIVQGGILAMAGVLVRILGLLKRIPLAYIIEDVGNSYYSAAYEIYNIVLTISSYGIPLSVSKLVSARVGKGQYKNAEKIFKCALIFALVSGTASSVLVYIYSGNLSRLMNEPMSEMALRVLAPTLFVVAVMGVFRGYFQGVGTMVPTAFSQLIEQVVLITVSLSSAYFLSIRGAKIGALLQNKYYKNAYGAAGATLGCSVGALASLIFLIALYNAYSRKNKKLILRDETEYEESTLNVFKALIFTIVPVVISSTVNNISNFLDQYIHNRVMVEKGLLDIKSVNWGIYSGKYLVLIGVPIAMANAMGASSVPTISAIMRKKNYEEICSKIGSVIRITLMISIPSAIGLSVMAPSVMYLLFSSTGEVGPNLVRIGSFGIIFFSFSTLTNGILQGMSKMFKPIIHGLIAIVIHVSLLLALLYLTDWNIYAVAFSNNFFSLVICILNLYSIHKAVGYRQEVKKTFIVPVVSAAIMGAVLYLFDFLFMRNGFSRILILVSIMIGVIVYFIFMIMFKGITEKEILMLPGGRYIYKPLHKLHIL
jgi:stage V sporulation protein B